MISVYFHGTSSVLVRSIVEHGLRVSTPLLGSGARYGLFFTDKLETARDWAEAAVSAFYDETGKITRPVVIAVNLVGLVNELSPDEYGSRHDFFLNRSQIPESRILWIREYKPKRFVF